MTILYTRGDIFESDAQVIVCPVNCVGAMGRGLALTFRERIPGLYEQFRDLCHRGLQPGGVQSMGGLGSGFGLQGASLEMQSGDWDFPAVDWAGTGKELWQQVWVLATKDHFKDPSKEAWVLEGLKALRDLMQLRGTHSVALPAIGCGLGGLRWDLVRGLINGVFANPEHPLLDLSDALSASHMPVDPALAPPLSFTLKVFEPSANGPSRRRGYFSNRSIG